MNNGGIFELLESDDELPSDYEEIEDIPMYLDDHRFDRIESLLPNNELYHEHKPLEVPVKQVEDDNIDKKSIDIPETKSKQDIKSFVNQIEFEEPNIYKGFKEDFECDVYTNNLNEIESTKSKHGQVLIKRGVLSKKDIYCLRCFGPYSSIKTFLKFIDFLMLKDIQSNYTFLKSCLVGDILCNSSDKTASSTDLKTHDFEIVILK